MKIKQKVRIKTQQTSIDISWNQTCLWLFVLVFSNQDYNAKGVKHKGFIHQKVSLRIIMSSLTKRSFMANPLILI